MSTSPESDDPKAEQPPMSAMDAATLRFLRRLVTVMTVVMCTGILGILALLILRYNKTSAPLPEVIALPDGSQATAYTQGSDWYGVVLRDDDGAERIAIYDRGTGSLRQEIALKPAP